MGLKEIFHRCFIGTFQGRIRGDQAELDNIEAWTPGQGDGTELLKNFEREAREAGAKRITGHIAPYCDCKAIKFYKKHGYTVTESRGVLTISKNLDDE